MVPSILKSPQIPLIFSTSLITLLLPSCLGGELRFCYHGPQRVQYKDCPGGFIAKKVVNSTCLYYYKQEGVPNMAAQFSDNICEAGHQKELDRDFQEFSETEFQSIQFTDIEEADGNETVGAESAPDKCNETCLADWVELKYWDPVPIFIDKSNNESNESAKEYVELTKIIMIRIINEDESDDDDDDDDNNGNSLADGDLKSNLSKSGRLDILRSNTTNSPMHSIMKLLAKSMRITYQKCEPYIETSFYTLVFRTMQEFQKMNSNFPSINIVPFKRIMNLLERCEGEANQTFVLKGPSCDDEKRVVHEIQNLKTNVTKKYKIQPNSFRWGRYDPIIEAAWTAVDFVHAFCFDVMAEDMLHYSLYVKAMIEVFVQPIVENHWINNAPVGKGMTLWEMAYDTPDIQNQMRSLDACVNAAYENSIYDRRLERPFTTQEAMEDPQFIDDPNIPEPGWNKTIEEYWKMYEKKGFKEVIDELGYCLQTPQDFNSTHQKLVNEGCETHLLE